MVTTVPLSCDNNEAEETSQHWAYITAQQNQKPELPIDEIKMSGWP
jgi:hypothetical protein